MLFSNYYITILLYSFIFTYYFTNFNNIICILTKTALSYFNIVLYKFQCGKNANLLILTAYWMSFVADIIVAASRTYEMICFLVGGTVFLIVQLIYLLQYIVITNIEFDTSTNIKLMLILILSIVVSTVFQLRHYSRKKKYYLDAMLCSHIYLILVTFIFLFNLIFNNKQHQIITCLFCLSDYFLFSYMFDGRQSYKQFFVQFFYFYSQYLRICSECKK